MEIQMLMIWRDAALKIGRHAWNVAPLEGFGYLLGSNDGSEIVAALPCSKTAKRYDFRDRWHGLDEHFSTAQLVADEFGLDVLGFYCTSDFDEKIGSPANFSNQPKAGLLLKYRWMCCRAHSGYSIHRHGEELAYQDRVQSKGKNSNRAVRQKRIYQAWLKRMGAIDYSNKDAPDVDGELLGD
jgi:hypothetical protein